MTDPIAEMHRDPIGGRTTPAAAGVMRP